MLEGRIRNILKIIDGITIIMAIYEKLIRHAFSFGLFLTLISLILHVILWVTRNMDKLKAGIQSTLDVSEYPTAASRFFTYLALGYVVIEIIALVIMFSDSYGGFTKSFVALIAIPICYSCLTLGVKFYDVPRGSSYGELQAMISVAPHLLIMFSSIFYGIWWLLVGIVVVGVFYAPVYFVSSYIKSIL